MSSSVAEFVRCEVADWDDDVVCKARFKAFSGQRSDWEPQFYFWRDLILKIARHLDVFIIQSSEVSSWFIREGLRPLCIDSVLLEMYNSGDILRCGDVMNASGGRLYHLFKKVGNLIGRSKSNPQEILEDCLVLRTIMQEKATEVIKILSDSHWNATCVITMARFQSICRGSNEASLILNYLSGCGKARYLSIKKLDLIEGVKVCLAPKGVLNISSIDHDVLHLIWTSEKLHQQHDVIDRHSDKFKKSAVQSLKSGNKQAALRQMRQSKLISGTREKCTSLLNRVEEVLNVLENAESTKQVSEAIQIGARAIRANSVSVEEVHAHLQELDESVASQKEAEEALGSTALHADIEDDDVEAEFMKLELELHDEIPQVQTAETSADSLTKQVEVQEPAVALSESLSKLKIEAA